METFVGDTVKLILKTGVDISGFEDIRIRYKKPNGETGEWIPTLSNDSNEWMEYTTLTTDLDQSGKWALQAFANDPTLSILLRGKWVNLEVLNPIHLTYTESISAAPPAMAASMSS